MPKSSTSSGSSGATGSAKGTWLAAGQPHAVPPPVRALDRKMVQPLVLLLASWLAVLDTLWYQGPGQVKGRPRAALPLGQGGGLPMPSLVVWLWSRVQLGREVGRGLARLAASAVALVVALAQCALRQVQVVGDWALGLVTGSWLEYFRELFVR
jgi:hypothetical protein